MEFDSFHPFDTMDRIIRQFFAEALNIETPYPHQLSCINNIVYERRSTLLVQPTASGKTETWLASASLLGGVTLCIMPTIALAAEQATRAQQLEYKGLVVYLKQVPSKEAQQLMNIFNSTTTKRNKPTILIACPQDLVTEQWKDLVSTLTSKNLLSLVVVDEIHQVPLSEDYQQIETTTGSTAGVGDDGFIYPTVVERVCSHRWSSLRRCCVGQCGQRRC